MEANHQNGPDDREDVLDWLVDGGIREIDFGNAGEQEDLGKWLQGVLPSAAAGAASGAVAGPWGALAGGLLGAAAGAVQTAQQQGKPTPPSTPPISPTPAGPTPAPPTPSMSTASPGGISTAAPPVLLPIPTLRPTGPSPGSAPSIPPQLLQQLERLLSQLAQLIAPHIRIRLAQEVIPESNEAEVAGDLVPDQIFLQPANLETSGDTGMVRNDGRIS